MRTAAERSWSTARIAALLAVFACAIGGGACHPGSKMKRTIAATPVADGESIGKIERSAGGTAVVADIRTRLTLSCSNDQLTLRTNLETLIGGMDCSRMIGQSIADRFLGQPVAVMYTGGAVQIENPTAGTIIPPNVTDLTRMNSDVTP